MHPPSRARRILKWTGAGLSLAILVTWIASLWFFAVVELPRSYVGLYVSGGICLITANGINAIGSHSWEGLGFTKPVYEHYVTGGTGNIVRTESIPLWLPFLLTAIPTAWLWHRDRRLFSCSPDHLFCSGCGYDLTGNTSGVCPECGDKACSPTVLADSECGKQIKRIDISV